MRSFAAFLFAAMLSALPAHAQELRPRLGGEAPAPIGWTEFCVERPLECSAEVQVDLEVILTAEVWVTLNRINEWVNETVLPKTDLDHWGVIEKWSYPDDGYGDCEDYALLKRRMLLELKYPRSSLSITVVRDKRGDGHAVLTVRTDKGDFVLDNQNKEIVLWSKTGYHFVKRQSGWQQNDWVQLVPIIQTPSPQTATPTPKPKPKKKPPTFVARWDNE